MTRKEEILRATLDLAASQGLRAVTLSQIADRVGIKTPSLYNHFKSKEEILQAAYGYLREQARDRSGAHDTNLVASLSAESLREVLLFSFEGYASFILDDEMLRFLRVLYAERSTSPLAAQIMVDETDRMIRLVQTLFSALVAHGVMRVDNVEAAALSYAMTVHGLVDYRMDMLTAEGGKNLTTNVAEAFPEVRGYIDWFSQQMEPEHA